MWPPQLPRDELDELKKLAIDWCSLSGLVVRNSLDSIENVHAPISLFPSPFPKQIYSKAREIQPIFNALVDKIAHDKEFLDSEISQLGDEFTRRIYDIYTQTCNDQQPIWLGIHRSDYLLDNQRDSLSFKQVELNTIASSFSSLSGLTSELHKYLCKRTDFYNHLSEATIDISWQSLPDNTSLTSIPKALAKAWKLYNVKDSVIMIVVQPGEKNIFDQRHLENILFRDHGIKCIRKTLAQIHEECTLGPNRVLMCGTKHVAIAYFRAGYTPKDYPSELEWSARLLIEKSWAVKCPNAAYHLVGCKKIQQVLAMPGVLERFVKDENNLQLLRSSFTGLYPLDQSEQGLQAYDMAINNPEKFVLKPQREGGGNNFYGLDVKSELQRLSPKERNAFILMDLIKPKLFQNIMVRNGQLIIKDVISELGIYGIFISEGEIVHLNEDGGHLLRTKSHDSNEGGVASGYAVLDSPLLV